ncbi:MAG TPA: hypothetical protein VEO54_17910 [Thermoanaerobaculia bacterium]|nr:hypothetical protein [Thermoanaerobaculia bacterium]
MSDERGRSLGGGAIAAALVVGVAGVILAVVSSISLRFEAAAVALLAAAVAFVGVSNAIFRH